MKIDILAIAAHPDDVELGAAGTLVNAERKGKKVGIIDLTEGELGTRGTIETRYKEANDAAKILNLSIRKNLQLSDGFFSISNQNLLKVIESIRTYQPDIILTNSISDRHPDHGRGGDLVERAAFLSGLVKIETSLNGIRQDPWRPKHVYRFVQDRYIQPDIVVDITASFKTKMEAIQAYTTQFYNEKSAEPKTPISGQDFLAFLEGRAREMGRLIGCEFGEGFTSVTPIGTNSIDTVGY